MDLHAPRPLRYLVAALFLGVSVIYPLSGLLGSIPRYLNGRNFFSILFSSEVMTLAWFTLKSSFLALSVTLLLSALLVSALYRARVPWIRAWFETSWTIPGLLMALFVLGVQKYFGVTERYGFRSIVIAWVLMGVPYLTLGWLRAIDDIDEREIDAFRTLGANRFVVWVKLLVPKTLPMVQSLLIHQFYWYLVSFSLVGVLGGGPPNETLEVAIYTSVQYDRVRYVEAVCLAIWQTLLLAGVRGLLVFLSSRVSVSRGQVFVADLFTNEWNSLRRHLPTTRTLRRVVAGVAFVSVILIVLNPEILEPVVQGASLALGAATISIALAIIFLLLRIAPAARSLAWISPMILSLAWWRSYALNLDLGTESDWALAGLVMGVQGVLFLPWALRFLGPVFDRARTREMDALRTLGATRLKAWWQIEWPRIRPDTRFLFSIIWSFALCEVSTVILFSKGGFEPLGLWVQNQLMRYRIHEAWIGTLLMVMFSVVMTQSRRTTTE